MSQLNDLELVRSFQNGEERAFNELVLRYQEKVYWVVRRFVGSHDQADDVVQEVFIKVYHGLKDFRSESSVFTWLYRISVNTALNHVRGQRIRDFLRLDDVLEPDAGTEDEPDKVYEREEQRQLIQEAVDRLPEKQKAVFVLRYFDELPYEEISTILRTSVGGLKANYFHAVKKVTDYVHRAHNSR